MKKLITLLIALVFCGVMVAPALAGDPTVSVLDRHAVWTKWHGKGNTTKSGLAMGDIERPAHPTKVSTQRSYAPSMKGEIPDFDFVRETKVYDYAKDRGNGA